MPELKEERKLAFYTCGRCKGKIRYLKKKGPLNTCPECGYSYKVHGTRRVNDVPSEARLGLNNLSSMTQSGSRGKLEQTTITSR